MIIHLKQMKRIIILCGLFLLIYLKISAQIITGTYAIQNIKTGKNLRPYEAGRQDGNKIVLYDHVEWKCMTWNFINVEGNAYQLKNLFTSKTFEPAGSPKAGCNLDQQKLVPGNLAQAWEFVGAGNESYNIRLKGTELYITVADASGTTNSSIILQTKQNSDLQLWRLVKQNPSF
jgi:hypothetical protein